ncbi:haloacid dehalogenase type II [Saccharopolyspora endophytica]|uniref:Haloacid dehalogenase type II n=1 Tax=Saccharopolyspora endophytica TaxID=543886 RepID=A0ABS5DL00_9PSEU|nr:haloacid dehalogenase type II [Saccharopolyspora endophytica]MBQ0926967.1 haloacid dehalogenase type II [Saccharopolyspora endophytica]
MPTRPSVVAFDVVETLMSLEPLRPRFADAGLAPELLERWFDRLLRDGMALTLAGDYEPFPAVAAAALRTLARGDLDDDAVAHVLAGFHDLPAHPDVEPAMRALSDAGISMICLSNGTTETTTRFLERNELDHHIDQVISVADVHSWKPPVRVYEHALHQIGRAPHDVALVAVHAFDCHGANRAGLTTGWARRHEGHYSEVFTPADVVGRDLVDVAHQIAALPEGGHDA